MALALRIRVTWEGDVVEDKVHEDGREVRVGTGETARVVAAGSPDRLVRFRRKGHGYVLSIDGGAAERVEIPGEDAVDGAQLQADYSRQLGMGAGRVVLGPSAIDFEVFRTERDYGALYLATGLFAVALVALMAGSFYKIVRQWGDGQTPRWGDPVQLGAEQAKFLRVNLENDAQGASKLAAGQGLSRHGIDSPLLVRSDKKPPKPTDKVVAEVKRPKKHVVRQKIIKVDPIVVADAPAPTPQTINTDDDDDDTDTTDDDKKPDDKQELITAGQQALLNAELRSAIDSLTAAEKTDKLDYDNLNWLGLAHYFMGENDAAEKTLDEAVAMDPTRPDAVNNLGGVHRRRGDVAGEIAMYEKALQLHPNDCHALNSLALALAKQGKRDDAEKTLDQSDAACGGDYAYTYIQRAGMLSLDGKTADAMAQLEKGLAKVDTLIPIKEYEVEADLLLDPAFAPLRKLPAFETLTAKYLPRAVQSKQAILQAAAAPPKQAAQIPVENDVDL